MLMPFPCSRNTPAAYPQSKDYTIALQRLGESYEGLLEMEYQRRITSKESAPQVKKDFLAKYGHYNCWNDGPQGLTYNHACYKTLLEQYPDSPIADEAAYRMIQVGGQLSWPALMACCASSNSLRRFLQNTPKPRFDP